MAGVTGRNLGFCSREMEHNFLGVAQNLTDLNRTCVVRRSQTFADLLPNASMLVIPPATGAYNSRKECWRAQSSSLFTVREMAAIINLVPAGGRLLAFSYRFGDSFTQTNLRDLLSPLGCLLNHDAVIDLTRLRITQPSAMVGSEPALTGSSGWRVAMQHVGLVLLVRRT